MDHHRVRFHRTPWKMLFFSDTWRATAYLASYIPIGAALFAIVLATGITSQVLTILWVGYPLLIAVAVLVQGCAQVERSRALLVTDSIIPNYAVPTENALTTQVRIRWTDQSILRNVVYLVVLFPFLLALNVATLAIWLAVLAVISLPIWYWALPMGVQLTGPIFWNLTIDTLPEALLAAAIFAVLAWPTSYLVVGAARLHATIARILLGPYVHPLAEARKILENPGPLATQAQEDNSAVNART